MISQVSSRVFEKLEVFEKLAPSRMPQGFKASDFVNPCHKARNPKSKGLTLGVQPNYKLGQTAVRRKERSICLGIYHLNVNRSRMRSITCMPSGMTSRQSSRTGPRRRRRALPPRSGPSWQPSRKTRELNGCLAAHGILTPLQTTFSGEAVLETNNSTAPGPFQRSVTGTLVFGGGRQTFSISLNPFSTEPFDTQLGKNVTTVTTNAGTGTYDRASGTVVVSFILFFDHSVNNDNVIGEAFAGDSVLRIDVATNKPRGNPLNASGAVTLVGDGVFENGFLGGNTARITIRGSVQPLP